MDDQLGVNFDEELHHKILAIDVVIKNLLHKKISAREYGLGHLIRIVLLRVIRMIPIINFLGKKFLRAFRKREAIKSTVTIVITTFNQPKPLLETCVASVLNQTFVNFRLIIIDDGSTNNETIDYLNEIINSFDPRISIYFTKNSGVVKARNLGIKYCRTKYVVFLDPDDSLEITFLEKCFLLIDSFKDKNIAVVHTDVLVTRQERNDIWSTQEMNFASLLVNNTLPITSLVKLKVLKKIGGFSNYMASGYEDWDVWVKMAKRGFLSVKIDEPLFKYTFSDTAGVDFRARKEHSKLHSKILVNNFLNPANPSPIAESRRRGFKLSSPYVLRNLGDPPVFIFVPWLAEHGGAEYFVRLLAEGLIRQKRTVVFVATHKDYSPSSRKYLDITPYVYELPKFLNQDAYIHFVKNLLSRCENPVIFNCGSTWLYEYLEEIVAHKNGVLRVYDVLFNPVGHLANFLLHQNFFYGVIPVYQLLSKLLIDDFKVKPKVTAIPVGISPLEDLRPEKSTSRPQIGWLGRLSEEKRPIWFKDLALVANLEADFFLAGSGSLNNKLLESIDKRTKLKLLGAIDNKYDFISSLDLMVNTSSIEGISLTAMEAIQLGVPVIAPRVGGMSELIKDGQNGYLYNPDDFNSLVSIIRHIVETPGLLKNLQKKTKEMGLPSQFQAESMLASYIKLLK